MSIQVKKRPYSKVFSGNPVHYELYSDQAAADATIFFEIKVMFKTIGGSYAALHDPLPYYPVNGYAEIDVKDILHSVLEYGLIPFYTDETTIWQAPQQTGNFYLQYREITSANSDPSWDSSELDYERFVIKGGLNYFQYRGNNFWLNYYDSKLPFLTWQVNGRLAAANERMYLAWLGSTQAAGLSMRVRVYYTDGTTTTKDVGFPSQIKDVVYYMPVGCDQLGLAAIDTTKTIWYWTVQVVDVNNTDVFSEVFKYELDNRNDDNQTTLHYRNSIGGLDSVRIRGVIEQDVDYSFTEQENTTTPDYFDGDQVQPQRKIVDNVEQMSWKGDMGLLRKEEQDRLRDAFLLRDVNWEISKKWWPVIISTKGNKLRTSKDQTWSMPIEWQLAYEGGEYYTPKSVDLGDGSFTSNVCMAFLSPMTVGVDTTGTDAVITIGVTENDPESNSTTWRWRIIKNSDGTTAIDWTNEGYGFLVDDVHLPKSAVYTLEAQAICTNNVYGRKQTVMIDTNGTGSGGAGGGGTGGGTGGSTGGSTASTIENNTSLEGDFELKRNGTVIQSGHLGAYGIFYFNEADQTDAQYTLTGLFSPSSAELDSNAVSYHGSVTTATINFLHVNVVNGMQIKLN